VLTGHRDAATMVGPGHRAETPLLLGLYSLVALFGKVLHESNPWRSDGGVVPETPGKRFQTFWPRSGATLERSGYSGHPSKNPGCIEIPLDNSIAC